MLLQLLLVFLDRIYTTRFLLRAHPLRCETVKIGKSCFFLDLTSSVLFYYRKKAFKALAGDEASVY